MDRRTALCLVAVLNFIAFVLIASFVPSRNFFLWYTPKELLLFGTVYFIANKDLRHLAPLPLSWRLAVNASIAFILLR
jgi:hypothetical protein